MPESPKFPPKKPVGGSSHGRSKSVNIISSAYQPTPGGRHIRAQSVQLSPRRISRSSFKLTPSWSHRHLLKETKEEDSMQLAFFPLLSSDDDILDPVNRGSISAPTRSRSIARLSGSFSKIQIDVAELKNLPEAAPIASSEDESRESSHFSVGDIWDDVPMGPTDAILGIAEGFKSCTDPRKVNVTIGAYRDENGKPWVLPSVRAAEKKLWEEEEIKEYLPIEGDADYITKAMQFAYGAEVDLDHVAAVQTLSGTGACRVGGTFLAQFWPRNPIYVPNPTWGNHIAIFKEAGLAVRTYRYYDRTQNGLDYNGMLQDIQAAPEGSIILLHACAHNPTGCDPTIEQWQEIIKAIADKEHVAFFDSAYQGFASGDAEADAQPFRYAVSQRVPILLAQSFAKNFGLYGERCGTLSVVCGDLDQKQRIMSELRCIIRSMYSSPPRHGSSIVKTILMDDKLKAQYYTECKKMADRINSMRAKLVEALKEVGSTHDWSHITRQIGMFAFTGLNEEMCLQLTNDFAIYLTLNGRISIAGLNDSNVKYVAEAIHKVSDGKSISLEAAAA